jgi:putative ABC transport system permease protein
MVIGSRLGHDYLGTVDMLTPKLCDRLSEHGSIVVDESELDRLGIHGVGDVAEIGGHRARVVGLTRGVKSLAGPYVFCSVYTAREYLRLSGTEMATYVLARCHEPSQAPALVRRLRESDKITAFTADEFSLRSRMHWLTKTKAGIALGYAAALGLLVGAVVTSQTLYAATAASMREYAVLRALGIPRWRMALSVLSQSFWVGLVGVCLALPASFALAEVADRLGVQVLLPGRLIAAAVAITMLMAMLSGLAALRSLRLVEPAMLLR